MELNLHLDENGRTTYDPPSDSVSDGIQQHTDGHPAKRARIDSKQETLLDYSIRTTMTNLHDYKSEEAMDSLLFDCEIADCALLPRTFWIPAQGMEPRCFLEKLALQIFYRHVPESSNCYYDINTSGAEWWVQIRPSPPAGRYSLLANEENDDEITKSGISFHWDKDEDLRLLCGGSMYIHPHLSTVTYLSDIGSPTMVLSKRVHPMTGENVVGEEDTNGLVCWPKRGKHLSFDGRFLHAAPSDLMENGMFERQCTFDVLKGMSDKEKKVVQRRHRRVTFLVNVWMNYKPFNVNPFPDSMLNSLSKVELFGDFQLFDKEEYTCATDSNTRTPSTDTKEITLDDTGSAALIMMTWPMGSCDDDQIEIPMPLETIRLQALNGSNVRLSWKKDMINLSTKKDGILKNG